jgi:hypothetical protein
MFNRKNVVQDVNKIAGRISTIFNEYPAVSTKINGVKSNYFSSKFTITLPEVSYNNPPSLQALRAKSAVEEFNESQNHMFATLRKTTVSPSTIAFSVYIERLESDGANAAQQEKLDEFTSSHKEISGIRFGDVIGDPARVQWTLVEMRPRNTKYPFIVKEGLGQYKVSLSQMLKQTTEKQSKAFKLRNIKEQ